MKRERPLLFFAWLALSGSPLVAQLVPIMNPSFDTNLAGWIQSPPGSSYRSVPDVDGCPGGHAVLSNEFDQIIKLSQCVLLSGAQPLSVGVRFGGNTVNAHSVLRVSYFSDTACSSFLDQTLDFASSLSWSRLGIEVPAPAPGTNSIEISLETVEDGVLAAFAQFDEVRVARAYLIFADGFEVGSPCRFSNFP